jgi:polar amino acid transport system substrate-binding protein
MDDFETAYVLGKGEDYFAFSIDTPNTLIQSFQQALYHVKNDKSKEGSSDYERFLYKYLPVGYSADNITGAQVIALVNLTAEEIQKNASDTIAKINAGDDPYRNRSNQGLYVFVYDTGANVAAHADNPLPIGKNFKGKIDVSGRKFRDEIVAGALKKRHRLGELHLFKSS